MATHDNNPVNPVTPPSSARLLIVGIAASAGGLEAFSQFLANVPSNRGRTSSRVTGHHLANDRF